MAIWKDYLRAVLKTRTTSAEASNASSPSESGVVTYPDNTKSIVPPADGFLRIRATGVGSGNAWLNAFQGAWGISQDNSPGLPCEVGIRVRKGAKVAISCSEGMKVEQIRLIKTIGGGYKRYLKALACNRFGGSLWPRLKTTSDRTVSKSSTLGCRTTVTKLLSQKALLNTLHRRTVLRTSVISSPLTALCLFKSSIAVTTSCSSGILSRMLWGTHGGIQDLSGCLKGKSSTLKCSLGVQEHLKRQTFVSTLTSANNARMEVAA